MRVEVRRSRICAGLGLFACEDAPAGTAVARYAGRVVLGDAKVAPEEEAYMYELREGVGLAGVRVSAGAVARERRAHRRAALRARKVEAFPLGAAPLSRERRARRREALKRRRAAALAEPPLPGVAQMANDAVHPELEGLENNCEFRGAEGDPDAVELVTRAPVRAGDELLVDYALGYWMSRRHDDALPEPLREWLACHARFQKLLRRGGGGSRVELHDYAGLRPGPWGPDGAPELAAHYTVLARPPVGLLVRGCQCGARGMGSARVCVRVLVHWVGDASASASADPTRKTFARVRCAVCHEPMADDAPA